jgi:hypothetical protein
MNVDLRKGQIWSIQGDDFCGFLVIENDNVFIFGQFLIDKVSDKIP